MRQQWILYVVGFVAACLYVAPLRRLAVKIDLVDRPSLRKNHQGDIPLIGGITMFLALLTCYWLPPARPAIDPVLMLGTLILVGCGVLDDRYGLSILARFFAQLLVTLLMIYFGRISVNHLGDLLGTGDIWLPAALVVPFTGFAVVGMINAVNMMDGMDGLAGCVTLCILLMFAGAAFLLHQPNQVFLATLAAAIICGFLVFNVRHPWRRRASIFMGDAGSMLLGFLLAWLSISLARKSSLQPTYPALPAVSALWILGFPVMETLTVIARRLWQHKSPFAAGHDHLHHLLSRMGLTETGTLLCTSCVAVLCGLIGVTGWLAEAPDWLMFYCFALAMMMYAWIIGKLWRRSLNPYASTMLTGNQRPVRTMEQIK